MRTPTGHSPRQHAPADHGVSRWLGWMISRGAFQPQLFCDSRISWRVGCWPLQTSGMLYLQCSTTSRFAFSHNICLTHWGSGEKPGMTSKEAKPWIFSLGRGAQAPRSLVCCVGTGRGSQPRAQGRLSRILRWARAELSCVRAQPALPCSPLPAGQLGWGREGDSSRKLHPGVPSAGSRLCCPRTGVGRHRGASAPSSFSSPPMPLPRAVRQPVPKKSWLVLNNLIVTEMWNDRRVSPRKVCFLNHYSIMLLHGTQKITPRAFSSSRLSG